MTRKDDTVSVVPEDIGIEFFFKENTLHTVCHGIEYDFPDPTLSRFYPLYEMAMGMNTKNSDGTLIHRDGYIFKDLK